MSAPTLPCPKCRAPLPEALFNRDTVTPCPTCGSALIGAVFPAFFTPPPLGRPGEALLASDEAGCFFHAEKKAVIACESCGRFLCALCDLEFAGRHICPPCLAAGRKKGALGEFDHFRLSWPGIALLVAIIPPIVLIGLAPANLVFGLVALVLAGFSWKKPRSLTGGRHTLSLTLAIILGLAETVALLWFGGKIAHLFYRG